MTDEQSTGETYNRLHELIRDGVNDIVADKFDKIKSPLHLDILLSRVIEFATGVSADLQRQDGSDAAIACAAGCSLCCHNFEVHASPFEVLRIADHIVNRLPPGLRDDVMARIREIAARKEQTPDGSMPLFPCPLLDPENGYCRVYDIRPLVCRGHNSINVKTCEARFASGQDGNDSILGSTTQRLTAQATLAGLRLAMINKGMPDLVVDLTTALALLIDNPDLLQDALVDPSKLQPARVKRWD